MEYRSAQVDRTLWLIIALILLALALASRTPEAQPVRQYAPLQPVPTLYPLPTYAPPQPTTAPAMITHDDHSVNICVGYCPDQR